MRLIKPICVCISGLILQGCSSVVLPTIAMLSGQSPLTADPEGFEILVNIPEGVGVRRDGAVFELEMSRSDTGEAFTEDFALQRRTAVDGRSLFRVNPDDLDALRSLQAKAIAWETEDPVASSGSFSVAVALCEKGNGPDPEDTYSVSIRTVVDGPFMPLIRNASVADSLAQLDALPPTELPFALPTETPCE